MRLNHRITLQRRVAGTDTLGQPSTEWEDVATVWANVEPLRGREFFAAGQMQAAADARISIRYRSDVSATWRAEWKGTHYAFVAPPANVRGESEFLEIMCQSGVGDGR